MALLLCVSNVTTFEWSATPIDIILTDLVMEKDDSGINLIRAAREIDQYVMAILFTAKKDKLNKETIKKVFEYGAIDIVDKSAKNTEAGDILRLKTRILLSYRQLLKQQLLQQRNFLRQHFDPRIFDVIEKDPSLLEVSQRTITIVFWDIRGFSKLCDILKAHPKLISGFLKEYYELGADVIFKHNGVLDKFIGDGIMAMFGVINHKDDDGTSDAISAVNAAKELKRKFNDLIKSWLHKWKLSIAENDINEIDIKLGCGIHTGEATVGNIETKSRNQFTALGPHVNFASRIESASKLGQILVSSTTEHRVKSDISISLSLFESNFEAKNIKGTFSLYSVNE